MAEVGHFQAFTVVLLADGSECLLLRREKDKSFAPGLWTGIGDRVEPDEFQALAGSAWRELAELDIIPSPRPVLPLLIADQQRDRHGHEQRHLGAGHYRPDGAF